MATAWPIALPQKVESDGFGKNFGNNVIRTTMDVGLDKLRKRYTKAIHTLSCSMKVDRSQYSVLENFYYVTLNSGTTPFTFTDPVSDVATDYRFTGPPVFRSIGGNYFTVTFGWEQLP